MSENPFIAEALLRASRPTLGLRMDIRQEEEEELRLEQERQRGLEKRERKFGKARGRGRWAGGLLGLLAAGAAPFTGGASLVAAAALTGAGSFLGQKAAVRLSPGAMKKFKRVSPGVYYVARGREREEQFQFGESERRRQINELMLTSAAFDAISGGIFAKGGGNLLDMILGRGGGTILPTTGGEAVQGLFPRSGFLT